MTTKATHASQPQSHTRNTTSRLRGRVTLGAGLSAVLLATSMQSALAEKSTTSGRARTSCVTGAGGNCTTGLIPLQKGRAYNVSQPGYFLGTYQVQNQAGVAIGSAFTTSSFTTRAGGLKWRTLIPYIGLTATSQLKLFVNGRNVDIGTRIDFEQK